MLSTSFILALVPLLASAAPYNRREIEILTETKIIALQSTVTATISATETVALVATTLTPSVPSAAALDAVYLQGSQIFLTPTTPTPATFSNAIPSGSAVEPEVSDQLVMGYYPDWAGDAFPPEKIPFDRFDWIDFAFALPDEHFSLTWDDPEVAPMLLKRLVTAAHAKGKKVKLSVGGWTGSKYFSPAVADPTSRLLFVNSILSVYTLYNLDGIDIDWEYPGQSGNLDNLVDKTHDTANFLLFLQLLRTVLPAGAKITAAALTQPWVDASGTPLRDMSEFAAVLDWVLLMNYDIWGSSPSPGPNSPLADGCGNSTQPSASADAGVRTWTVAGFPAGKLVLGLPAYGYISKSRSFLLHGRNGEDAAVDSIVVTNENGGTADGQVQFRELIRQGALADRFGGASIEDSGVLSAHFNTPYDGAHGYIRHWDHCSATPYLRSAAAGQVITYDDPESIGLKASLAKQLGLKGVNMFDVHGDTDRWELIDAARRSLYYS